MSIVQPRITQFCVGPLQANCYIVTNPQSSHCIIIDAGMQAADAVRSHLRDNGLTPAAIMATHGHIDHVADAQELADDYQIPVIIHPDDRHLLSNPQAGLTQELAAMLAVFYPQGNHDPRDVQPLNDSENLHIDDLNFRVLSTPGHTAGSVVYTIKTGEKEVAFTGDTLFAGSIGRTDLPGGSSRSMLNSITYLTETLSHDTVILPGHGPKSTMGAEIRTNPYLG